MTIFDNIKRVSKQRGYSLQSTAEKAGLSKNAIYQYNNGKNPSYATLTKIADVLGVTVPDLMAGDNYDISLGDKAIGTIKGTSIDGPASIPVQKDPSKPLTETQEFTLMAAHWGEDLNKLSDEDKHKVIKKAEGFVKGLIAAYEDKD